jgi:hypothetical protein
MASAHIMHHANDIQYRKPTRIANNINVPPDTMTIYSQKYNAPSYATSLDFQVPNKKEKNQNQRSPFSGNRTRMTWVSNHERLPVKPENAGVIKNPSS